MNSGAPGISPRREPWGSQTPGKTLRSHVAYGDVGTESRRFVAPAWTYGSRHGLSKFVYGVAELLCLTALSLSACRTVERPIFEPPAVAITWPPAPQAPRIRYVGELKTSDDLKARTSGLEGLRRFFVGKKEPSPLFGPRSVVCTPDGQRVWMADPGGRCLHCFDLEKRTYLKVEKAGPTHLLAPVDVALGPPGSIYVCDSEKTAIHRLDDQCGGLLETLRLSEEVRRPVAAFFDPHKNELFVVDVLSHDVKVLDERAAVLRVLGRRGEALGEFNYPTAIVGDGPRLWVADSGNHRVQAISPDGTPLLAFGRAGDAPGDLALPKSVAVDPDGHLYVVDGRFENIQVFNDAGQLLLFFGEEGSGPGQFWLPGGMFIEPGGRIWVCDSYNRRVQVFEYVREAEHAP